MPSVVIGASGTSLLTNCSKSIGRLHHGTLPPPSESSMITRRIGGQNYEITARDSRLHVLDFDLRVGVHLFSVRRWQDDGRRKGESHQDASRLGKRIPRLRREAQRRAMEFPPGAVQVD